MFAKGEQKIFQRFSVRSLVIAAAVVLVISSVSIFLFGFAITKHITINDNGTVVEVTTTKAYVEEVLAQQNIILGTGDRISIPLDSKVKNKDNLVITRATKFQLTADGETKDVYSCEATLKEALADAGISLNEHDEITPVLETPVTEGMEVRIYRVEVKTVDVEELMQFEEKRVERADKEKGYVNVVQEGDTGWAKRSYKIVTRDGEEVSKEMLSEEIVVGPVDKIVEYGTSEARIALTSRGEIRYKKVLQCTATAYDASPASNGGYSGTATGRKLEYGIVAVDPRVIPLHSRLYIESSDGGKSWVYGYAVAGDTGGAIKGNKVDLFFNSRAECYQFGRQSATVYVLD